MKTSEVLKSLLCDPEGNVCINGSVEDKRLLQQVIKDVEKQEVKIDTLRTENDEFRGKKMGCRRCELYRTSKGL